MIFVWKLLEYTSIASTGNSANFGTGDRAGLSGGSAASSTRAVYHLGVHNANYIEYVEFSTKGNTADFGDVTVNRNNNAGTSNATRGLFFGGESPVNDIIDYITIATIGNATDFGDLTDARGNISALCNTTRAVAFGGYDGSAYLNDIWKSSNMLRQRCGNFQTF